MGPEVGIPGGGPYREGMLGYYHQYYGGGGGGQGGRHVGGPRGGQSLDPRHGGLDCRSAVSKVYRYPLGSLKKHLQYIG